jgi:hypothetical protein
MQIATNKMVRALEEQADMFKGYTLREVAITVEDYRVYLQPMFSSISPKFTVFIHK